MATIKTVVQYETVDGSIFLTEAEANQYEFLLENKVEITFAAEAYANTLGAADRSRSIKLNAASDFLAFYIPWVAAGKPEVERTVFDAVKVEAPVATEAAAQVEDEVTGDPAF